MYIVLYTVQYSSTGVSHLGNSGPQSYAIYVNETGFACLYMLCDINVCPRRNKYEKPHHTLYSSEHILYSVQVRSVNMEEKQFYNFIYPKHVFLYILKLI